MYCASVNREHQLNVIRIRPKTMNNLINIVKDKTIEKNFKDDTYTSVLPVLGFRASKEFCKIQSLLFLKTNSSKYFYDIINEKTNG